MIQQFLRLFFLLIISLVVLAWSLDQVWDKFQTDNERVISVGALFQLIQSPNSRIVNQQYQLTDLAWSDELLNRLLQGETIQLQDGAERIFYYKLINNKISVIGPLVISENNSNYFIIIASFYLGFALIIVIWLWPLFNDLQRLRIAAKTFSEQARWWPVPIKKGSMAYPVAKTLNIMASDLDHIITLQKEMSRTIGHEIRTPLARIQFSLESLKNSPDEDELKCIEEDITEIEQLTDEFLQLARLEYQTEDLLLFELNVDELITGLLDKFQRSSSIKISYQNDNTQYIFAEPKSFTRLLQNLITNALKYANSTVKISLYQQDNQFQLEVADDGVGFKSASDMKRPFTQEHYENIGYGLGLAIVGVIADWYQGEIVLANSAELGGGRVTFIWPNKNCR